MNTRTYESYPLWIVLLSVAHTLAVEVIGAVILSRLHVWLAVAYLLYCGWMEVRTLTHCRDCAYYGKRCAFGRGLLCATLLPPGDPARFAAGSFSWRDMLPDLGVMLLPLLGGIVALILDFRVWVLALMLLLVLLATLGNSVVRGSLACAHCQQREVGCPALALFEPNHST
ncbi:MAG: hypothetical protein JXA74_11105 [Anaerolineae bacterium]|nr:hypothetical protein [Anaerolineae bacterium]